MKLLASLVALLPLALGFTPPVSPAGQNFGAKAPKISNHQQPRASVSADAIASLKDCLLYTSPSPRDS